MMRITIPDGTLQAYVARPTEAKSPVVIVLQEIFGVNADIRATCDELASHGFLAIAPELFWREAPGLDLNSWSEEDWARGMELYEHFDIDRGVRDIAAVVDTAMSLDGASGRVGVMGFCLGGLMTFMTACRISIDGAVVYYGGGTDQHLQEAPALKSPLLMHLGEDDEFISQEAQTQIKAALNGKPEVTVLSYPRCAHAFARHTGTHYNAEAAALANARTYAFFRESLKG